LSIDDFDCDELISRLVGPLSPPDRIALLRDFCSLSRE
jgi:hypothetical protein